MFIADTLCCLEDSVINIKHCQNADEMYVFTLLYFSEGEKVSERSCRFYLHLCIHFVRHCTYTEMQFE